MFSTVASREEELVYQYYVLSLLSNCSSYLFFTIDNFFFFYTIIRE